MTSQTTICASISTSHKGTTGIMSITTYILLILLAIIPFHAMAQQQQTKKKTLFIEHDSIPILRGFTVQFNIAGIATRALSDRGEIEGALRINLHDEYFPIFELGYGTADHDDEITNWHYKTNAPYFRLGMDWNLLRNKHTGNRIYGGFRYAFTSFKTDLSHPGIEDPVWNNQQPTVLKGEPCRQHWAELVFGVEAKILGPLHLGWNVRYKRRISHRDPSIGNAWYVPGFGKAGSTCWGGDFNVIIDI